MTKLDITKKIAKIVVGWSTGFAVANIVRNNTAPRTSLQKGETAVAGFVLGSMVGDLAESYTNQKIDEIAYWWKTNVDKTK